MNFFDDFERLFARMDNIFNRPVKDQKPFTVYQNDKGYIVVCNTLGINRNDLKINISKELGNPYPILSIVGETKIEKIDFSNNVNLRIRLMMEDEIESVSYETKDGLTLIYLKMKQLTNKIDTLEAKYIDDGSNPLDW